MGREQRPFLLAGSGCRGGLRVVMGVRIFPPSTAIPVTLPGGEHCIPKKTTPNLSWGWQGMSCFTIIKGVRLLSFL
jgi:hypothetical protein